MNWILGIAFACMLGALVGEAFARVQTQPELVILCEKGVVLPMNSGALASGRVCVMHSRDGSSGSADALSVYSETDAAP